MTTLNLIGAGRVGRTLATLWARHGVFEIQDVLTSSLASAQEACTAIGAGSAVATMAAMRPADVWMVAVQDARITEVASALAAAQQTVIDKYTSELLTDCALHDGSCYS